MNFFQIRAMPMAGLADDVLQIELHELNSLGCLPVSGPRSLACGLGAQSPKSLRSSGNGPVSRPTLHMQKPNQPTPQRKPKASADCSPARDDEALSGV